MPDQAPTPQSMPPALAFLLTRRLPCAALMVTMLMGLQLPLLFPEMPAAFAMLILTFGLIMHLLAPALIALITYGGGALFALQVAGIAAAIIALLNGFAISAGIVVFLLYGLLPTLSAMAMMQADGIRRSAEYVAIGAGGAMLLGLLLLTLTQDLSLQAWIEQRMAPMFAGLDNVPADEQQAVAVFKKAMASIMPGLMALSIWMLWWGNLEAARHLARKYSFYRGNTASMLTLSFDKPLAYAFAAMLLLVNAASGDIQFIAASLLLLFGGLLAAQGVAVVHSWLKAKGLGLSIGLMYVMLLIWSALIVPMLVIGLLDLWNDYRRNIPVVGG